MKHARIKEQLVTQTFSRYHFQKRFLWIFWITVKKDVTRDYIGKYLSENLDGFVINYSQFSGKLYR